MAYVESAVVVYLRLQIGSGEKLFPLTPLPPHLLHVELARELATLVMLAAVSAMQSRNLRVVLAFFLYCFGIWDLFYYIWLKILIGWPASLMTWDVLFLVPVPWFAPVLSPSIVSLLFVAGGLSILRFEARGRAVILKHWDFAAIAAGTVLILVSYFWEIPAVVKHGRPDYYPWWLFALGAAIWVLMLLHRLLRAEPPKKG